MAKERAVFLDYGGLLFDYDFNRQTLFRAHAMVLEHLHSHNSDHLDISTLAQAHDRAIQTYLKARGENNYEWAMEKITELVLKEAGINDRSLVSSVEDIYKLNDHDSRPLTSVVTVLPELARRRELGIISNLPHDALIHELREYGLLDLFKTITISYQVGFRKPHPQIYREALKRANARAEESLFISHDKEEVLGAERIGMKGLLVNSLENILEVIK